MNDTSIQYKAIFTGIIDTSVDKTLLKLQLQNRYQLSENAVVLFFQNRELVMESNLSYTDANKLYTELKLWGMEIKLIPQSQKNHNLLNHSANINHLITHRRTKNQSISTIKAPALFSFDFTGRYDSSHFLRAITIQSLLAVFILILAAITPDHELIDILYPILLLMWGLWSIRSVVLRLHDFDQNSTGIQMIAAIPIAFAIVGLFVLSVLFYLPLLFKKGTPGKNRFGLPLQPLSFIQNILSASYYFVSLFLMLIILFYLSDQEYLIISP